MNIHYDQTSKGMGWTGYNSQVDYRGFKCWMYPDMFLRLAAKIFIDPKDAYFLLMKNAIRKGKPIASPYFQVTWDDAKQVWEMYGHEGRHRVEAIKELWPNEHVEIHIIPVGKERAKDITPQMLQSFMEGVIAQDDTYVEKPTAKIEHLGKIITPQSQQQVQQPMMEELKKNDFSISKMEEQYAVQFISKTLIPICVEMRNEYNRTGETELRDVVKTLKKIDRQKTIWAPYGDVIYYQALFQGEPYIFRIYKGRSGKLLVMTPDAITHEVV